MDDLAPPLNIEDDLFGFETEHLALKGNEDYCEVLKSLVKLAALRERALKDFKKVAELRLEALNDPFGTLARIQNGDDLGIPGFYEVPKLPVIDFKKYKVQPSDNDLKEIYSDGQVSSVPNHELAPKHNNRSWSAEEQKQLEELLQVYPPEPVEMKRYQKIAKALGNRTATQVASRLQKYFLKLYKAGLPIPGRIPKCAEKHRKSALHRHQRHNHYLLKPSSFFPKLSVPVQMEDLNNIPGPSELSAPNSYTSVNSSEENYLVRSDYLQNAPEAESTETEPELQLRLLKRVREAKVKEEADDYVPFTHSGFKCDYCDESPIVGTRWHCTVCSESVDFCTDCVISQMYTENPHSFQHWLASFEDDLNKDLLVQGLAQPSGDFERQINEELEFKRECDDEDYISDE